MPDMDRFQAEAIDEALADVPPHRYYIHFVEGGWGIFDNLRQHRGQTPIAIVPKAETARCLAEGLELRRCILSGHVEWAVALMKDKAQ